VDHCGIPVLDLLMNIVIMDVDMFGLGMIHCVVLGQRLHSCCRRRVGYISKLCNSVQGSGGSGLISMRGAL
jgi:hypothetical protein